MAESWKITVLGDRDTIQSALVAHEDALDWNPEIVLSGCEVDQDRPNDWMLETWLSHKPKAADRRAVAALFTGKAPMMRIEKLPDIDWVSESQKSLEPIRAGRFFVRTSEYPASNEPGIVNFEIPASRAFGTGHHETTAGCLAMLDTMKRRGVVVRNCADIGTGTGLLAFAALKLWPHAIATASDIDPLAAAVTIDNAQLNSIPVGGHGGELVVAIAEGMDHPLISARGPYDLIIANILAGPLISLSTDFSDAMVPGGSLLLSGLLTTQEEAVRRACRKAGLRLAERRTEGDWSILWLRKRPGAIVRGSRKTSRPGWES